MISPINFVNIHNTRINNNQKNNIQIKNNLNQPNCDTVCFTGAAKVLKDACDKAFVNILTKDLELSQEAGAKLKNTVWDFLRENKIQSLGEIGGEEHFDEQVELQGRITKVLSVREEDNETNEYIADELIKRCDEGKDYIPKGMSGHLRGMELENIIRGKIRPSEGMRNMFENSEDDSFYQYTKKLLRQTPDESYEFRETVNEYLKENNLKSITELFNSEEFGKQAGLLERLEEKFNLGEDEITALNFEFLERANTNALIEHYTPEINSYIKDFKAIRKLSEDMGLDEHKVGHWNFNLALFREMSDEADKKGLDNIFELLKPENNFKQSETYKFLKERSGLTEEEQTDTIIELAKIAKNPEEYAEQIPKHVQRENFYANIKSEMIVEQIADKFGLENIKRTIDDIASKQLKDIILGAFPEHIKGGKNHNLKQVAFEIADTYKLPTGAEKQIEIILDETISGGTQSADAYAFNKLKSELGIE